MDALSPLAAYEDALARQGFAEDPAQRRAATLLEVCQQALQAGEPRVQGVYLWGPVGRGKTWLMDRFHASLSVPARRQHFHHFMRWVHQRLFALTGTPDPLLALARELATEVRVLCFDELFVSDIGDALILGRLLQAMFDEGVTLVATSNQPPSQLYADGFNRDRFLPAIRALERHTDVVEVDGGQDHRLHPGAVTQRYWVADPDALAGVFRTLNGNAPATDAPLQLAHREVTVRLRGEGVLWCDYAHLCEAPLAALDFIELCDRFPAILLGAVPVLGAAEREGRIARGTEDAAEKVAAGDRQLPRLSPKDDGVRRFIALVDECYDRRVPLYLEAAVPLEALYTEGGLAFPFRRTLSRLREMQMTRFA